LVTFNIVSEVGGQKSREHKVLRFGNRYLGSFGNFSTKLLRLVYTNLMQKIDWKNIVNFKSCAKSAKSGFDPPSWIDSPFFTNMKKYEFGSKHKFNAKR
jgi:hypothetical protein